MCDRIGYRRPRGRVCGPPRVRRRRSRDLDWRHSGFALQRQARSVRRDRNHRRVRRSAANATITASGRGAIRPRPVGDCFVSTGVAAGESANATGGVFPAASTPIGCRSASSSTRVGAQSATRWPTAAPTTSCSPVPVTARPNPRSRCIAIAAASRSRCSWSVTPVPGESATRTASSTWTRGNRAKTTSASRHRDSRGRQRIHEHLPQLLAIRPQIREVFAANNVLREHTGNFNAALQAGYFILAIRPGGRADGRLRPRRMDAEFFPGTTWRSIVVVNIGHPGENPWFERLPRLDPAETVYSA